MNRISAVIITLNEESNIRECLESIRWVDEIIIVDSGSTDRTLEIAKEYFPTIYTRDFDNFCSQKNFGIDKATGEWILAIDADETVDNELKDSILAVRDETDSNAYFVLRKNFVFGKLMKHGCSGIDKHCRFFRKEVFRFTGEIHEKIEADPKSPILSGFLLHKSTATVEKYLGKLNHYTYLEARELYAKGKRTNFLDLWFRPFGWFIYYYVIKLGFLDGVTGLIYHILSANYVFFKYVKLWEIQDGEKKKEKKDERQIADRV